MSKLLDYIRLCFFACGLLLGVQVPAFVSDFGQALNTQLIEVNTAIAPFKKDAAQYFNNDLRQLIKHYQNLDDDIINKGGQHISSLDLRQQRLQVAVNTFAKNPYTYTLTSDLNQIKKHVWQQFEGQIILKKDSIIAGIIAAIVIAILAEFIGFLLLKLITGSYKKLFVANK